MVAAARWMEEMGKERTEDEEGRRMRRRSRERDPIMFTTVPLIISRIIFNCDSIANAQ